MDSETIGFMPASDAGRKKSGPNRCLRLRRSRHCSIASPRWIRKSGPSYLAADQAMDAAHAAENALMGGERIGRLHGVPVTIKDLCWTKDMPTQSGSLTAKGFRPMRIRRLSLV